MNSDINMYLGREKAGLMRKRALLLRKGCSFEITRYVQREMEILFACTRDGMEFQSGIFPGEHRIYSRYRTCMAALCVALRVRIRAKFGHLVFLSFSPFCVCQVNGTD